jgi:hypothetical protein
LSHYTTFDKVAFDFLPSAGMRREHDLDGFPPASSTGLDVEINQTWGRMWKFLLLSGILN